VDEAFPAAAVPWYTLTRNLKLPSDSQRTFAFFPVAVDVEFEPAAMVEFEPAAMVEFEALAFPPLGAFPFFPVALVLAARAVAVSLAKKGKQNIVSDSMCNLPAALFFFGERAKTSETGLRQRCFLDSSEKLTNCQRFPSLKTIFR
jgi:hypothetical protein